LKVLEDHKVNADYLVYKERMAQLDHQDRLARWGLQVYEANLADKVIPEKMAHLVSQVELVTKDHQASLAHQDRRASKACKDHRVAADHKACKVNAVTVVKKDRKVFQDYQEVEGSLEHQVTPESKVTRDQMAKKERKATEV